MELEEFEEERRKLREVEARIDLIQYFKGTTFRPIYFLFHYLGGGSMSVDDVCSLVTNCG